VLVKRSNIEEEDLQVFNSPVKAEYFPLEKEEQWWILIGDPKASKLLGIKKVNLKGKVEVQSTFQIEVNIPEDSKSLLELKVYLFCDGYIGCD